MENLIGKENKHPKNIPLVEQCSVCGVKDEAFKHCKDFCLEKYCGKCNDIISQNYEIFSDVNDCWERRLQSGKNPQTEFWFHKLASLSISTNIEKHDVQYIFIQAMDKDTFVYALKGQNIYSDFSKNRGNAKHVTPELKVPIDGIAYCLDARTVVISYGINALYEFSYASLRWMFCTESLLPTAISSLNNGRIVVVGFKLIMDDLTFQKTTDAALQVYEFKGALVKDIPLPHVKEPSSVCVNKKNNDIYVGDYRQKQITLYSEDGTHASTFTRGGPTENNFDSVRTSHAMIKDVVFPSAIAYNQEYDLVFASYFSSVNVDTGNNGIFVLSSRLHLLGHFYSEESVGKPSGLTFDNDGKLYVGDGENSLIKLFTLFRFKTNFQNEDG